VDIKNFKDVVKDYRNLFFDIWGVVHDGISAYNGTVDLINDLSKTHNVFFLSNAPRANSLVAEDLRNLFSITISDANVMTSGVQTAIYLNDNKNALIYSIGEEYVEGLQLPPMNFTKNIDEASHILCIAYHRDYDDLDQYDEILKQAAQRSIPLICANPDTAVIHGSGTRYCAGHFAEKYANFGGVVLLQGKPDKSIYETLASKILSFKKEETLMIGDTFATDIQGAKAFDIDSALVLTGNAGREIEKIVKERGLDYESAYNIFMQREKIKPSFIVHGVF
jgi:HAD superfamily hydrolase (TIGR01459 family)